MDMNFFDENKYEKIPNYFIEEQFREFKNTITIEEVEDK